MGKKSRAKAARRDQVKDARRPGQQAQGAAPAHRAPPPVKNAPPPGRPSPLSSQVQELIASGQPEAALGLLQRTAPGPGEEAGHRNLVALALVAMHRYEEAYPLLVDAASAGLSREIHLALAETEANLGLTAHAERRIRRLSQAYPNHPAIVQARAYARSLRDARQARAEALDVDASDLEEAESLLDSTRLPMSDGDFDSVIKLCESAVERCPLFDRPRVTLALARAAMGDDTGARDALRQAREAQVELSPPQAAAAAKLYVALGQSDLAREITREFLGDSTDPAVESGGAGVPGGPCAAS